MKKIMIIFLSILFLFSLGQGMDNSLAIKGGTFYTITKGMIEQGVLLIKDGKIEAIGRNLIVPESYQVIDAQGKIITPGFVLAYSQVGLEGDLLSDDYIENTDPITPQMRAIDAFYPLSKSVLRLRNRGITTAVVFPSPGNVISGQGAILKTVGTVAEKMAVRSTYGILFSLGEKSKRKSGMPRTRMGEVYLIKKTLNEAQKYMRMWEEYENNKNKKKKPSIDFKLEPLVSLLKGKYPAFIHCNKVQDIINAIKLSETYKFDLVLVEAQQANQVTAEIKKSNIPVFVAPLKSNVWDIEKNTWEPKNAKLLYDSRISLAIVPGQWPSYGSEELTFYAAYAIRYGLPEEEALKAITIYPAQILGLDTRIGSLEKGKDADILIMDNHPFRVKTKIEKVIIGGKMIDVGY
jgi:imidazolonepropionase-like amidohydrolase